MSHPVQSEHPARPERIRRLVARLSGQLAAGQITACDDGDVDPRTARHVSGVPVGVPLAWARPADASQLSSCVQAAVAERVPVVAVGAGLTFWGGLRMEGSLAIDTSTLRSPGPDRGEPWIDGRRRIAHAGAGVRVAEVDRAARREGLCLAAYPDASGDNLVGTMLAVGCTAGLGLGQCLPIELVSGATVVDGRGQILRLGASHWLAGRGFTRHGLPDALGLVTAAEGRGALIADVCLLLHAAPFVASARLADRAPRSGIDVERVAAVVAAARASLDRGRLHSLRWEAFGGGRDEPPGPQEILLRSAAPTDPGDARLEADLLTAACERAGFQVEGRESESDAARRGESPDYDRRWTVPPGAEHRARVEGGSFWGLEVAVSWGDEWRSCFELLVAAFDRVRELEPRHRRLAIYPGRHLLSLGMQVLGGPGQDASRRLADALRAVQPRLLGLGAVPYRTGTLWPAALAERLHGADAQATTATLAAMRAVFDPDDLLGGAED